MPAVLEREDRDQIWAISWQSVLICHTGSLD